MIYNHYVTHSSQVDTFLLTNSSGTENKTLTVAINVNSLKKCYSDLDPLHSVSFWQPHMLQFKLDSKDMS